MSYQLCTLVSALLSSVFLFCYKVNATNAENSTAQRVWLAGDHHIHSQYSVGWDRSQTPPKAIIAGDAIYPIPKNAKMAEQFGLAWMVTTDHGGPGHSKVNFDFAYPELVESRKLVANVVQFYGLELNTPSGDHSSIIIPHTHDEADVLKFLESSFDAKEPLHEDPSRDTEDKMLEALQTMQTLASPPLVFAHHPSRSAKDYAQYGEYEPREFRRWNDAVPEVAVGMEGSPGHQAFALSTHNKITEDAQRVRGGYRHYPTLGGFDQMTAKLGGFWDSMLAEGRNWWITANSDSHVHYSEGGVDFWPGEYSKTYVFAMKNHDSILANLRAGHVFVTTGDLISELYVDVSTDKQQGAIGEKIIIQAGDKVTIRIKLRDPQTPNAAGNHPSVKRIDLILGDISGKNKDLTSHSNATTHVAKRFSSDDWHQQGEWLTMQYEFNGTKSQYVRVRGTNTEQLEPELDPPGENPWDDLWFYSNPVFVEVHPSRH